MFRWCCSVGTILFTALGISVAVIGLHGATRVPDDLFTDEAEVSFFGLLLALGLTSIYKSE